MRHDPGPHVVICARTEGTRLSDHPSLSVLCWRRGPHLRPTLWVPRRLSVLYLPSLFWKRLLSLQIFLWTLTHSLSVLYSTSSLLYPFSLGRHNPQNFIRSTLTHRKWLPYHPSLIRPVVLVMILFGPLLELRLYYYPKFTFSLHQSIRKTFPVRPVTHFLLNSCRSHLYPSVTPPTRVTRPLSTVGHDPARTRLVTLLSSFNYLRRPICPVQTVSPLWPVVLFVLSSSRVPNENEDRERGNLKSMGDGGTVTVVHPTVVLTVTYHGPFHIDVGTDSGHDGGPQESYWDSTTHERLPVCQTCSFSILNPSQP